MDKVIKIGLLHEGKVPPDYRVALTPFVCKKIKETYPNVEISVQSSGTRSYTDDEYKAAGFPVTEAVNDCDILLGVKEVPIGWLIPGKTYFYFSHTHKKQPYNRALLKAMVDNDITMIDYETLVDDKGARLIGFGHYAGLVGAHNALLTYGRKTGTFELKAAHEHFDYEEMVAAYRDVRFPAFKIALTGGGNVAIGAREIMAAAGIQEIAAERFMSYDGGNPVFAHFEMDSLYADENGGFDKATFYAHPEQFVNRFVPVTHRADIIINGIFWKSSIPRLFETEDVKHKDWAVQVIADITCDPFGSVPINIGASTITDPVYGVNRWTLEKSAPYISSDDYVDMMTIDNLPNELARDASSYFSEKFYTHILPELLKAQSDVLERATICKDGALTSKYSYLHDFIDEHMPEIK